MRAQDDIPAQSNLILNRLRRIDHRGGLADLAFDGYYPFHVAYHTYERTNALS